MGHFRVAVCLGFNYCKGNEFDLHNNSQLICAPELALKLRHAATRKWAIPVHMQSKKEFL